MLNKNTVKTTLTIVIVAAAGLFGGSWLSQKMFDQSDAQIAEVSEELLATTFPTARPLKEFQLHDQHGNAFGREQFSGKWSLVFFGYTNCPDVCPTTLTLMKTVYANLLQQGFSEQDLQIVFVSVDPDRDDNAQLAEYISYFNPAFVGITGTKEQIDIFSKQLSAIYFIRKPDGDRPYEVDHSASILLIDPDAGFKAVFTAPHNADQISHDVALIRQGN